MPPFKGQQPTTNHHHAIQAATLETNKLNGLDGEIGTVREFCFDGLHWTVRYLVADTGNWLPGRWC